MEIQSPITGLKNTKLERNINTQKIIEEYKKIKPYGIDVNRFFHNMNKISIYTCLDTGYRFFYPNNLAGDDLFYQELEKNSWYYMDWKWEHEKSMEFIHKGDNVLEIGCAHGAFLEKLKNKEAIVTGLEMNTKAIQICKNKKLNVIADSIEHFSQKNNLLFDVVCTYQVLEHIKDAKSFIESSLSVLKPNGLFIISVPNNDPFILKNYENVLDMPPHHLGSWNTNSLIKLQYFFPFTIQNIFLEPLQSYHLGYAKKLIDNKLEKKIFKKIGIFKKIAEPIIKRLAYISVYIHAENMIGHTVLAVYKKI